MTTDLPRFWFVLRNLIGSGLLSLAAGVAIVLICVVLGLTLRAGLELLGWLAGIAGLG